MLSIRPAALLLFACAYATAEPSVAQTPTTVSPRRATSGFSDSSNSYPFGQGSLEYQQVHSSWSFTNRGPLTLTGIRLTPTVTTQPARIEFEMWMANSPHGAAGASSVFANNEIASSRVRVVDRRFITLPANSVAWGFHIPFDRPFTWSGGHLTWRVRMHGNSLGGASLQYGFASDRAINYSSRTGSFNGCAGAGATRAATHDGVFRAAGQRSTIYAASRVANTALPGFFVFGLSASSTQAGVPLPIALDPLGATGCILVNDVRVSTPFVTEADAYGSVYTQLTLPTVPGLPGQRLYTQAVFLQPGANALGVFLSPGATNVLPGANGLTRIYNTSGAATGGLDASAGLVIGFTAR